MSTPNVKAGPAAGPAFAVPELSSSVQVWLVRHGETEWSSSGQHTGSTDIPLTARGEEQARALRDVLAGVSPVLVLSSPKARALDTARLAGIRVDGTTADLEEWDYGDYEGRTSDDIHRENPGWTVFADGCPGGESVAQVQARADRVLTRVLERVEEGPVMLFGHGHFGRVLGARWIGLPAGDGARLLLGTAAPCVLGAEHGVPALDRWNLPNPAVRAQGGPADRSR